MNNDLFLILLIFIVALITIFPLILRALYVPTVIALLVAGILISDMQLGMIPWICSKLVDSFGGDEVVVATYFRSFIDSLGNLGLVFLMALAGMEADFKLLGTVRKPVYALSLLTFLVPAATGYIIFVLYNPDDLPGKLLYASLFASHSVGIVFPVMRELNLSKTRFGASVLISTIATDIASIILLAICVQMKKIECGVGVGGHEMSLLSHLPDSLQGGWLIPCFLLITAIFITLTCMCVRVIGHYIKLFLSPKEDLLISLLFLVILATVLVGNLLGINLIVSAFIAGLAFSPLLRRQEINSVIFSKMEGIGYGFLIPFLFISIGMQVDLSVMLAPGNITIVILTVVGLVASKTISGWLAMRISGFSNAHGLCAGLMTVPQLSATLAAATVGRQLNMLDDNFFNAIVVLSIVTTIPVPAVVRMIITRKKLRFDTIEEEPFVVPAQERGEDNIL